MPEASGHPKLRSALVLCRLPGKTTDVLVCGISTRIHQHIRGWDEPIRPNDPGFSDTGLHRASIIRLSFLAAMPRASIAGGIGRLAPSRIDALQHRLARRFTGSGSA